MDFPRVNNDLVESRHTRSPDCADSGKISSENGLAARTPLALVAAGTTVGENVVRDLLEWVFSTWFMQS
jgi:hypothetical protein